jgi:peptidoglycan hydrolase-like protein with peptidoglycan-binding domain
MARTVRTPALVALALVAAACGGNTADTTTTTEATTTTVSTLPATTTSTGPTTTTTTMPPSPVLATEGDDNEIVAAFQFLLNCGGYGDLTVDGEFGAGTTTAMQDAQEALGFDPTGDPTEDFFIALNQLCPQTRSVEFGEDATVARVFGHTSALDPENFSIPLIFGSTLSVTVVSGVGAIATVWDAMGTPLESEDGINFLIEETGDYRIEVSTAEDPTLFTIEVEVTSIAEAGQWIITTDGIAYEDTEFLLGTSAGPMITKIFEFLGHGVRSGFGEFDTGWNAAGQEGFRGVFIEGIAFLFIGPNAENPGRPETFARVRYVGPSFDAEGNPRPAGYVQTLSGITVGHTLEDLIDTYGTSVRSGSNSDEHYYRYGAADGSEVCFYFGEDAPDDDDKILEISTECRS